jgi:hypothetical protein
LLVFIGCSSDAPSGAAEDRSLAQNAGAGGLISGEDCPTTRAALVINVSNFSVHSSAYCLPLHSV